MNKATCIVIFLAAHLCSNSQDSTLDKKINFFQIEITNSKSWVDTLHNLKGKVTGYRYDTAFFNSENKIVSYRSNEHRLDSISKPYSSEFFYTPDGYSKAIFYPFGVNAQPFAYFYFKEGHPIRQFDPDNRFSPAGVSSELSEKRRMMFDGTYSLHWIDINKNGIQMLSLKDQMRPETYFKKDSFVIRVPGKLEKDFYNLFQILPSAFDSIYSNCSGIMNLFLEESLRYYCEKIGASYIVYFESCVVKADDGNVVWILKSRAPQGGECYPVIYLKKRQGSKQIKSIIVRNGRICQI